MDSLPDRPALMGDVTNSPHDTQPSHPGYFPCCRAKVSGGAVHIALCITERPGPCPYCIPFGRNYLCRHPNSKAIIELTGREAPQPATAAPPPAPAVRKQEEPVLLLTWNGGTGPAGRTPPSLQTKDIIYLLEADLVTIGRAPENAIQEPDGSASWHHAELTRTPSGTLLRDLDSSNGTFINEKRIAEKTVLNNGDIIRFGTSEAYEFVDEG